MLISNQDMLLDHDGRIILYDKKREGERMKYKGGDVLVNKLDYIHKAIE